MSLYTYVCRVVRVIDGDTVDVIVDLGFGIAMGQYAPVRLRLADIDAPEMRTEEGQAAKDFADFWLTSSCPAACDGTSGCGPFLLRTVKSKRATDTRDSFGRYLAQVAPIDGGQTLNEALIEAGHARRWER